jgi:long-chain acyl-CoA synthetase
MTVLLTGATGFLGMEVLVRLLEETDAEIITLVRARDREHATKRIAEVLGQLYDWPPPTDRIRALPGDIAAPGLGLAAHDRREIVASATSVLNCAASISFELPLGEALEINTAGTVRMMALAAELRELRRIVHVSTAYVAGRHRGVFHEHELDVGQPFRNTYEQSKFQAERELHTDELPLVVARPSIVVGDRHSGWTPAFNVIYWPLRAFARGLLDEVPVDPHGIVDIVPVDYVADALVHLLHEPAASGTVHLVAGEHAVTNAQLIETASHAFNRPPPRINGDAAMIAEARTYLPYFDVATRFDDRRARELLGPAGIASGPLENYFPAILDYARRARWGKTPLTRQSAQLPRAA